MANLELKKNRGNYEANVFYGRDSKSAYRNIIDKDYKKIAQVLIDLFVLGFPIDKAIVIFRKRFEVKDWIGI